MSRTSQIAFELWKKSNDAREKLDEMALFLAQSIKNPDFSHTERQAISEDCEKLLKIMREIRNLNLVRQFVEA